MHEIASRLFLQLVAAAALVEGLPSGVIQLTPPRAVLARVLVACARTVFWFYAVCNAERRCERCGFWMTRLIHLDAFRCLLCGHEQYCHDMWLWGVL